MTFVGIVACQVGTAMAARTCRASLRTIGVFSNHLLIGGIAFELAFTAALLYVPALRDLFGMEPPPLEALLFAVPFPFIVWGIDEFRRFHIRRREARHGAGGLHVFSRILIGLDGSQPSLRAVACVDQISADYDARIDVIHVREVRVGDGLMESLPSPTKPRSLRG